MPDLLAQIHAIEDRLTIVDEASGIVMRPSVARIRRELKRQGIAPPAGDRAAGRAGAGNLPSGRGGGTIAMPPTGRDQMKARRGGHDYASRPGAGARQGGNPEA